MAANTKPLTTEAIALTEKKMDMTLDDIIKMSKPTKKTKSRVPNKNAKTSRNTAQDRSIKAKQFLAAQNTMRQGALAKRRSNFQDNQFPVTSAAARRAATAPVRPNGFTLNRNANWNNSRVANRLNQRANAGFNFKEENEYQGYFFQHRPQHLQYHQQPLHANLGPRPRPQTLDSLFANMKEQRLKTQQNFPSGGRPSQQRRPFQQRMPFQGGQRQQQRGRGWFSN